MDSAHGTQVAQASIAFDDWKHRIQMATDVDQLVRLARLYLGTWTPDELAQLPCDLGVTAMADSEAIVVRAVIASRTELKFEGTAREHALLREMALTFTAAAIRLRFLKSFGTRV